MSKQWRRRLAVVAVETQYGVAPDPATATILEVVMLDAGNPYAGNTVERERMRYGFGNFEQIRPTTASLSALDQMLAYAMQRFSVPMSRVYTHQELRPTACPGRNLQAQMNSTRSSNGRLAQMVGQTLHRT